MKWIDGLTAEEKYRIKSNWHTWFAWHPVCVAVTTSHHKVYAWWEDVLRIGTCHYEWDGSYWTFNYKEKE